MTQPVNDKLERMRDYLQYERDRMVAEMTKLQAKIEATNETLAFLRSIA